jgi:6,7-dimethyl-8-ribityllumazine synthase
MVETNVHTVALVVAGETASADVVIHKTVKAVVAKNIAYDSVAITKLPDPLILPNVVKRIVKEHEFKVVVAVAVVSSQSSAAAMTEMLMSSLHQVGLSSDTPIIPSVLSVNDMVELKGLLAHYASTWAESATHFLSNISFSTAPPPEPAPVKPVHSEDMVDAEALLDVFRESLKVLFFLNCYHLFTLFVSATWCKRDCWTSKKIQDCGRRQQ